MSKRLPPFKDNRYQKNTSTTLNTTHHPKMKSTNFNNFTNYTSINQIQSSLINENQDFYKFRYTLQDKADNSNIVFFDSASRKFRTRSASKSINTQPFSKSIKSITRNNLTKNDKIYNRNANTITINRKVGNDLKKYNSKTNIYTFNNKISINSNNSKANKINERQEKESQLRNNINRGNRQNKGDKYEKSNNNNNKKVSNIQIKKQDTEKNIQTKASQGINIIERHGKKKSNAKRI